MKVAFDIHGTIDTDVGMFKKIMNTLTLLGIEVSVMSGPPVEIIMKQLKELRLVYGIHYKDIYSVVDYLTVACVEMKQDNNGNWWAKDTDWWSAKGKMCERYGISTLIDNEIRYKNAVKFPTNFILYNKDLFK